MVLRAGIAASLVNKRASIKVGRLQKSTESAYTALMHYPIHISKHLLAATSIGIASLITTGCYTPQCGTYYRQPVTYAPEPEVYTTTYNYPAYTPVLIPVELPRYTWNADFHRRAYHQEEGGRAFPTWSERPVPSSRTLEAPQKIYTSQHQFTCATESRQSALSQQYHSSKRIPSYSSTGHEPQRQPALVNN